MATLTAVETPKTVQNKRAVKTLVLDVMPKTPHIGMQFNPDTTDSIGTIHRVVNGRVAGRRVTNVTYSYAHAHEVEHTRDYVEVQRMAWAVR